MLLTILGDLMKEEELLSWLVHQKRHSEIPDISDEIMEKLIDKVEYLAVLFCKSFLIVSSNLVMILSFHE